MDAGYIYILCNDRKTVLYVGATNDLKKRAYFHKKKLLPGFTKRYNVDRLVYFEQTASVEDASVREKQLKRFTRVKKESLISKMNPDWNDLFETL